MSDTHEIQVEIVPTQHNHANSAQFLIKYQSECLKVHILQYITLGKRFTQVTASRTDLQTFDISQKRKA